MKRTKRNKNIKKVISLVLGLVMVMGLSVPMLANTDTLTVRVVTSHPDWWFVDGWYDFEEAAPLEEAIVVTPTIDGEGRRIVELSAFGTPGSRYVFEYWYIVAGNATILSQGQSVRPHAYATLLVPESGHIDILFVSREIENPGRVTVSANNPDWAHPFGLGIDSIGFGASAPAQGYIESGEVVTFYAFGNEGFEFIEWTVASGDVTVINPSLEGGHGAIQWGDKGGDGPHFIMPYPAVDVEIVAVFRPIETPSSWAVEPVNAAIAAGLVPQSLQSQYTQAATRAEFTALAVALYETVTGREIAGRMHFNDTNDINVQKMGYLGIVAGVGDGNFAPNSTLTREQAAVMLARLADVIGQPLPSSAPTFADNAQISSWAVDGVGQMQASGIMGGVGNNQFSPSGSYTREQSIVTMMRLFDILK